jgi:hypothetical protein
MRLASWLPQKWLCKMARSEAYKKGEEPFLEGFAFWMDAQYWRFVRDDQRQNNGQ